MWRNRALQGFLVERAFGGDVRKQRVAYEYQFLAALPGAHVGNPCDSAARLGEKNAWEVSKMTQPIKKTRFTYYMLLPNMRVDTLSRHRAKSATRR